MRQGSARWGIVVGWLLAAAHSAPGAADPFDVQAALLSPGTGPALRVRVVFTVPPAHHLYADQVLVTADAALRLALAEAPRAAQIFDSYSQQPRDIFSNDVQMIYTVEQMPPTGMLVAVRYQGCSEALCFLPRTKIFFLAPPGGAAGAPAPAALTNGLPPRAQPEIPNLRGFTLKGRASGYLNAQAFLDFLDRALTARGAAAETGGLGQHGVLATMVLVILGGLALNLTPCVLPMVPINLAIIGAGVQAGSRRRGFLLGGLYGLGIALTYGAIGVGIVLTGSKVGAINASPWFNVAVGVVFVLLALAMVDVLRLDFSRFQRAGAGERRATGPALTAVIMGGVAAVLAGACVAPAVIAVLLFASTLYVQGIKVGLLLPFLLGIGMALPWPFAGAGMALLPRPGAWMTRVKYVFAAIILAAAVYYGAQGIHLLRSRSPTQRARVAALETQAAAEQGWLTSLPAGIERARREGKPLCVDFWASWCKSCLAMERTTFKDPRVLRRLDDFVKVKYRAETPDESPVREVLDRFEVLGLPTYIVLVPDGADTPSVP
jgi:thiol:disulfide interchange protein